MPHDVPEPGSQLKHAHYDAFACMASELSLEDRNWIVEYVAKTGISMSDQGWLPAALAARLILGIRRSSDVAHANLAEDIRQLSESAKSLSTWICNLDETLQTERARRSTHVDSQVGRIETAAEEATNAICVAIARQIEDSVSLIETRVHARMQSSAERCGAAVARAFFGRVYGEGTQLVLRIAVVLALGLVIGGIAASHVWHRPQVRAATTGPHIRRAR